MTDLRTPQIPLSYTTPPFPSLYWPIRAPAGTPTYLYTLTSIWRFTLFWTLLTVISAHILVSLYATLMHLHAAYMRSPSRTSSTSSPSAIPYHRLSAKNRKLLGENPVRETASVIWVVPLLYGAVGGVEALIAGSLVGLVVGAVYNAGYYKMSTWVPFLWGMINSLVLILSSFRIQGGL